MDQAVVPLWLRISLIVPFGFIADSLYHGWAPMTRNILQA
jgi:hypothetical protein